MFVYTADYDIIATCLAVQKLQPYLAHNCLQRLSAENKSSLSDLIVNLVIPLMLAKIYEPRRVISNNVAF